MDNNVIYDYGELMCEAVNHLIGAALEGLSFDITKQCVIVDDSDRDNYRYIVSDGSVKFEAFADVSTYRNGTTVYVNIPNGDYTMQKIITGRQVGSNTQPFVYTAPLETMIEIENHALTQASHGLLANSVDKNKTIIPLLESYSLEECQGFTRLGISADFKAWLAPMDTNTGTYGIYVILTTEEPDSENAQIHQLTLSSDDMYGNPYNFESFFSHEKVFDISNIGKIKTVSLYAYQNNNFYDGNKNLIPSKDSFGNALPDNIFVQNVRLLVGYDQSEFVTDKLDLYTSDSLTYTNIVADAEKNRKKISLRWIHKDIVDNRFKLANQEDIDNKDIEIRWYRYELGAAAADEYCGPYWTHVASNQFIFEFDPDVLKAEEQIKVVGLVKTQVADDGDISWTPYYSSIITFENTSEVINQTTVDATAALSIVCQDGSEGNYFIYNQNGNLNDNSNGPAQIRTLKLYYKGTPLEDAYPSGISEIRWYIPKENTMLSMNNSFWENASNKGEDTMALERNSKKYYQIIYNQENLNGCSQSYAIRGNWSQEYSNNTIECIVIIDNREYQAVHELRFGKAGTTGTDITLVLNIEDNANAIINEQDAIINVAAYLYDAEGKIIPPEVYSNNLTFDWKYGEDWFEITQEQNIAKLRLKETLDNSSLMCNYHILSATVKKWADGYDLIAYVPIPIKTNNDYSYIAGAKEVIYNHQGTANYSKVPYLLYNKFNIPVEGIWGISYLNDTQGYAPGLKETLNGKVLQASQFYMKDENDKVCIFIVDNKDDKNVLWTQPILIIQNQYDFAMLNSWDGSLTFDEENGTILSTMLGAGRKTSDNTFSGVLIGDIKEGTDQDDADRMTGVYGFDEGILSFALKEDGSATFGSAGNGQIHINGTSGIIQSSNYIENASGMALDLTNGRMQINSKTIIENGQEDGKPRIILQPADPQLIVKSEGDATHDPTELIHIGTGEYYLQSDQYDSTGYGTFLDLSQGIFKSKNSAGIVTLQNQQNLPFFQVAATTDITASGDLITTDLIYMGTNNYYLKSSQYDAITIATAEKSNVTYQIYNNSNGQLVAVPADYLRNDNANIYLASATQNLDNTYTYTVTTNAVTIPTIYYDYKFNNAGLVTDANGNPVYDTENPKQILNPKDSYLSSLTPVLTSSGNGRGLFIDLNNGIINGYDLYLRGTNRDTGETIVINSGSPTTPLSVGEKFSVAWDGTLTCQNVNYLGTKPNTGQYIININDHFTVSASGGVSGSTGNFGGGWFGGTAARVVVGSGGANTNIAGIENNRVVDTGYSIASLNKTLAETSATIEKLSKSINKLITAYNKHTHSVTSEGGDVVGTVGGANNGNIDVNVSGIAPPLGGKVSSSGKLSLSSASVITSVTATTGEASDKYQDTVPPVAGGGGPGSFYPVQKD